MSVKLKIFDKFDAELEKLWTSLEVKGDNPFLNYEINKTWFNIFGISFDYEANTNMRGEKRADVVTGQYEKVLPMDWMENAQNNPNYSHLH